MHPCTHIHTTSAFFGGFASGGGGRNDVSRLIFLARKELNGSHTNVLRSGCGSLLLKLRLFTLTAPNILEFAIRSEEHTSELQSLMRISYAVFCLKNKK